jgi:hypothetical protein
MAGSRLWRSETGNRRNLGYIQRVREVYRRRVGGRPPLVGRWGSEIFEILGCIQCGGAVEGLGVGVAKGGTPFLIGKRGPYVDYQLCTSTVVELGTLLSRRTIGRLGRAHSWAWRGLKRGPKYSPEFGGTNYAREGRGYVEQIWGWFLLRCLGRFKFAM